MVIVSRAQGSALIRDYGKLDVVRVLPCFDILPGSDGYSAQKDFAIQLFGSFLVDDDVWAEGLADSIDSQRVLNFVACRCRSEIAARCRTHFQGICSIGL